jgi:hypothetical protein
MKCGTKYKFMKGLLRHGSDLTYSTEARLLFTSAKKSFITSARQWIAGAINPEQAILKKALQLKAAINAPGVSFEKKRGQQRKAPKTLWWIRRSHAPE